MQCNLCIYFKLLSWLQDIILQLLSLWMNVVALSCVILLVSYVLQTFPEQAIHWKIDWPKQNTMIANMKLESIIFSNLPCNYMVELVGDWHVYIVYQPHCQVQLSVIIACFLNEKVHISVQLKRYSNLSHKSLSYLELASYIIIDLWYINKYFTHTQYENKLHGCFTILQWLLKMYNKI